MQHSFQQLVPLSWSSINKILHSGDSSVQHRNAAQQDATQAKMHCAQHLPAVPGSMHLFLLGPHTPASPLKT